MPMGSSGTRIQHTNGSAISMVFSGESPSPPPPMSVMTPRRSPAAVSEG